MPDRAAGAARFIFSSLSSCVVALAAAACALNPATGQRQFSLMSEDQEIQRLTDQPTTVQQEKTT